MMLSVHCVFFFHEEYFYKRKVKQTLNCPSHVIGGGYACASPPAIRCSALAPRASPVEMAWGYAVKRIICLVHYGKGKSFTQNQSYTHLLPLNTRKEFRFKAVTRNKQQVAHISVFYERRMSSSVYLDVTNSILGADLQTILRCIARNAGGAIAGLCAVRAPFWSPKRGDVKGFK